METFKLTVEDEVDRSPINEAKAWSRDVRASVRKRSVEASWTRAYRRSPLRALTEYVLMSRARVAALLSIEKESYVFTWMTLPTFVDRRMSSDICTCMLANARANASYAHFSDISHILQSQSRSPIGAQTMNIAPSFVHTKICCK